jgi:hypothetical protein
MLSIRYSVCGKCPYNLGNPCNLKCNDKEICRGFLYNGWRSQSPSVKTLWLDTKSNVYAVITFNLGRYELKIQNGDAQPQLSYHDSESHAIDRAVYIFESFFGNRSGNYGIRGQSC